MIKEYSNFYNLHSSYNYLYDTPASTLHRSRWLLRTCYQAIPPTDFAISEIQVDIRQADICVPDNKRDLDLPSPWHYVPLPLSFFYSPLHWTAELLVTPLSSCRAALLKGKPTDSPLAHLLLKTKNVKHKICRTGYRAVHYYAKGGMQIYQDSQCKKSLERERVSQTRENPRQTEDVLYIEINFLLGWRRNVIQKR